MTLNLKQEKKGEEEIKVGKTSIKQTNHSKLLGMVMDEDQTRNSQIDGKGGILASLNSRLFLVKRLKKCVNSEALKKIADSLLNAKIRYGLQLLGKVRIQDLDETQSRLKKLQISQNKMT